MEKSSLIAWRHREKQFPETAAQRRARARAQITAGGQPDLRVGMWQIAPMAFTCEELDLAEDEFLGITDAAELVVPDTYMHGIAPTVHTSGATNLRLPLTADQCQVLRVLPLLTDLREKTPSSLFLQLEETQQPYGITLQFSLHPAQVPEMMPLKDLCRQLKVGRRAVMRLIRRGELRCYRVGNRYRFSVTEVKDYLARMASQ